MLELIMVLLFGVPGLVLSRSRKNKGNSDQSPCVDPVDWGRHTESPFDSSWRDEAWRQGEGDYLSAGPLINYAYSSQSNEIDDTKFAVNPATGLNMVSGEHSGVDVGGNPYGLGLQWGSFNDPFDCPSVGIGSSEDGFAGIGSGSLGGNDQWS